MREWRLRVKDQQEASESAPRDHFWLELGFWRVDCDLYGSGMSEEGGGGMWRYGSDLFRVMVVLLWNMEHQSSSNIYQTKPDRPVQSLILIPRWLLCLKQIIWDAISTTPVCWISSRRSDCVCCRWSFFRLQHLLRLRKGQDEHKICWRLPL